ncbi:MAG TPA: DNA polymerase III subunit gamma/tau [Candidatus Limnocylindrales bacterium]|nr:DNA polymerase III subunit gamma/tau [Candidatus Limnocylindrales bacterium]
MSTTAPQASTAPHQAIYRRWRAQTFSEIVGQGPVVETLRNAVRAGRVSHATLFVGPRGTGKTSLARILAKALNCTDLRDGDPCDACEACVSIREGRALDLVEIDAASNRGIDAIRDLRERINYAPTDLRRKVYILDEAHQITKDAWNALLKSLEEPPDFVAFMFASTHPQDFPPAILSRLQRYDVRRLTVAEIEGKLERILAAESIEAEASAVHLIARLAAGGMRDAESMLDQLLATASGRIDEGGVRDLLGLAESESVDRLVGALVDGDAVAGIAVLDELDDRGRDIGIVLDQVIETIRAELSAGLTSGADPARLRGLTRVARRLSEIDPERRGVGGLRLQVELAVFAAVAARGSDRMAAAATQPVAPDVPSTPPEPEPSEEPAPKRPPAATRKAAVVEREVDAPPVAPDDQAPRAAIGSSGDANRELDRLMAGWADVVASVRPATRAIISECRPMAIDGNVITLGFPEAKAFLKEVADRKRPDLEAAVGAFLGRTVAVRCVATNLDLVPPAADDEQANLLYAEARRIFADQLEDIGEVS